jgi:cobaltochelatase CobN
MHMRYEPVRAARGRPLGQLVLCSGCCCGRVERGFPAVPVERIKAAWKAERLNRTVQLTIAGCLGPCDLANVAAIVGPRGQEWFGQLGQDAHYEALLRWARACHAARTLLQRPEALAPHQFEAFRPDGERTLPPAARPIAVAPAVVGDG